MSKKRNSVTATFRSEYCVDTYFIDSFKTEKAQDTIIIMYDVKYYKIRKHNYEKFNILYYLYPEEASRQN